MITCICRQASPLQKEQIAKSLLASGLDVLRYFTLSCQQLRHMKEGEAE